MLSTAQQIAKYRALDKWFKTNQGQLVSDAFVEELQLYKKLLKGHCLLQLGDCSNNRWLNLINTASCWMVSPDKANKGLDLVAETHHIPLERDSIDIVIVPLSMEVYSEKINLIDEIDRVLKPMGYVVVLGINPWGLWGLASKLRLFSCFGESQPFLHSPMRVNRQFNQRGYRQCVMEGFYFLPPLKSKRLTQRMHFLNVLGKMLWPFPSSFYCYIAQKFEEGYPPLPQEEPMLEKNFNPSWEPAINFDSDQSGFSKNTGSQLKIKSPKTSSLETSRV